jgi:hypothetical protein
MQKIARTLLIALLTTMSASLAAAPIGYSINSDSPTGNADSLYRIDLAIGAETRVATVRSLDQTRIDVEGLALAPDGTLYGMDDDSMTLFALNPDNASVLSGSEFRITGMPMPLVGGHDFGMTFACDGNLYATALAKLPDSRSLFRVDLSGNATRIGAEGSLNPVTISALAAWGNPVQLYGLGNGADGNGDTDTPFLYRIDSTTGIATEVGPLGPAAGPYLQGGLAFDDSGQLWAITEGALFGWPSQVMRIDRNTGTASAVKNLLETGFESLAITVPRGCQGNGNSESATFTVQKLYVDGNDQTPVTLNIRCETGQPAEQSVVVLPQPGPFGAPEAEFTVDSFADGALNCEVFESAPPNYTPSYECFSEGDCSAAASACRFSGVAGGQENLCVIRNRPDPVDINVVTEWIFNNDQVSSSAVTVDLFCRGLHDGDGYLEGDTMSWSWLLDSQDGPVSATVYPRFDGTTECRTEIRGPLSAVESVSSCNEWAPVAPGAGDLACAVTNSVFFKGIPALNTLGLLLATLLLLTTGLLATRRF